MHYHVNTYKGASDRLVDSTGEYKTKREAIAARERRLDDDARFWGDLIRAAVLDLDHSPDSERVLKAHAATSLETAYTLLVEPCRIPKGQCVATIEARQYGIK